MKLAKAMLVGALLASLGLLAGNAMADLVLVSTAAATTISSGDTGRKHFYIQNTDTVLHLYVAKTSTFASPSSGTVVNTYGSVGDSLMLLDYSGPVYGIAEASSTHAPISVRTFKVAR